MKLQQLVDIWDKYDNSELDFFQKKGKNVLQSEQLLLKLLELKWSKQKRLKLVTLAWMIRCDIRARHFGFEEEIHFSNILPIYRYFEDYMSCCCAFFGNKQVPFEEWEDLAKEQVDILKMLVEKNQLKSFRRTKIYLEFCDKYEKREEELVKKGYGQLWDSEYQ